MTDKIYLDSNIIIHRVEGEPALKMRIRQLLTGYIGDKARFWTSGLTVGEGLIGAHKKDPSNQLAYQSVFVNQEFISLADVTLEIIQRTAILGANFNMKLVDAIHAATAEALGCSVFITNDRGIRAPVGIELRYLPAEA